MFDQSFPVQGSPKLLPIYNLKYMSWEQYVLRTIDRQRDVPTPGNLDWHCLAGAMPHGLKVIKTD